MFSVKINAVVEWVVNSQTQPAKLNMVDPTSPTVFMISDVLFVEDCAQCPHTKRASFVFCSCKRTGSQQPPGSSFSTKIIAGLDQMLNH